MKTKQKREKPQCKTAGCKNKSFYVKSKNQLCQTCLNKKWIRQAMLINDIFYITCATEGCSGNPICNDFQYCLSCRQRNNYQKRLAKDPEETRRIQREAAAAWRKNNKESYEKSYHRYRMENLKKNPKARRCSLEDCERIHFAKGFCKTHYVKNHYDIIAKNKKSCQKDGCEKLHYAKGFCRSHYERNRERNEKRSN